MPEREFPIQNGPSIPWWLAEACYARAGRIWHNPGGQSLERLAERGGWSRAELGRMLVGLDVMDDAGGKGSLRPLDPSPLAQLLARTVEETDG